MMPEIVFYGIASLVVGTLIALIVIVLASEFLG